MQGHTADDGETKNRTKGIRFFVDIIGKKRGGERAADSKFPSKT